MSYLYADNVSPRDRFDQVVIQRDNGTSVILRKGNAYSLSAAELANSRAYIVLIDSDLIPITPDPAGGGGTQTIFSSVVFSQPGPAQTGVSGTWRAFRPGVVLRANLSVVGAPVGSSLSVDVMKNSASIATLIIANNSSADVFSVLNVSFAAGDEFYVNSTSVGSTTPATGVVVQLDTTIS